MVAGDGPKGLLLDPLEVTIRGALLHKNTISTDIDFKIPVLSFGRDLGTSLKILFQSDSYHFPYSISLYS